MKSTCSLIIYICFPSTWNVLVCHNCSVTEKVLIMPQKCLISYCVFLIIAGTIVNIFSKPNFGTLAVILSHASTTSRKTLFENVAIWNWQLWQPLIIKIVWTTKGNYIAPCLINVGPNLNCKRCNYLITQPNQILNININMKNETWSAA